jgi:hypothetical protein
MIAFLCSGCQEQWSWLITTNPVDVIKDGIPFRCPNCGIKYRIIQSEILKQLEREVDRLKSALDYARDLTTEADQNAEDLLHKMRLG